MIENFPVKIDNLGRVLIPNNIRKIASFTEKSFYVIKENTSEIVFDKTKDIVRIDNLGRVLIPKKIRDKYFGDESTILFSATETGFILKKKGLSKNHLKVQEKIDIIKSEYSINSLLISNDIVVYTTNEYKHLINSKKNNIIELFDSNLLIKEIILENELTLLLIYKNKQKSIVDFISKILA